VTTSASVQMPMVLLSTRFDPHRAASRPTPWAAIGSTTLVIMAIGGIRLAVGWLDGELHDVGQGIANAAVHAGFLVGGGIATAGTQLPSLLPLLRASGVLFLASIASRFSPWGAALYLSAPILLFRDARRWPAFRGIGVARPSFKAAALGIATGASLGVHLLVSASLTLGYAVRVNHVSTYLTAVAYDIGAGALTAEWVFRGAVFSRCWQRWEFWPATCLSAALAVARYLLDPALPSAVEARAGAVFYMALLGVSACAFRAASGSLLPGYLATVTFFLAYRLLAL